MPVRLNTNENSYPLPETVVEAIEKALAAELRDLNRYPDRDAVALRADLAAYLGHGLTAAQRVGGQRLQRDPAAAAAGVRRPGAHGAGLHPVVLDAPAARRRHRHRLDRRPARRRLRADRRGARSRRSREHRPDVVFLCSPNNPTGTALDPAVVDAVLDAAPRHGGRRRGVRRVRPARARPARSTLLPGHPRLVVTRTMSKAFGFAGGRLGYLAADPAVVDAVQLVRLPYHLSALTQAAARAALAHARRAARHGRGDQGAARPDRRRRCASAG